MEYKIDKEWLNQEYIGKERSAKAIAEELDCSLGYIYCRLREYGIPTHRIVKKKIEIGKEWLIQEYAKKERSAKAIAEELDCCVSSVYRYLRKYGIPRRRKTYGALDDEEWLAQEYVEKRRSAYHIAEEIGCDASVVYRRLKRYEIPLHPASMWGRGRLPLNRIINEKLDSKEWLIEEYTRKKRSVESMAEEFGCGVSVIYTRLKEHGISTLHGPRPGVEWTNETFFDNLNPDSAYVLGFIIADGHIPSVGTRFSIAQKDEEILDKLSNVMIGGVKRKLPTASHLAFAGCPHAVNVLTHKYGIPRGSDKSLTVRLSEIILKKHRDLLPHLIRGYFDGDGSVTKNGVTFSFSSGSYGLLEDVATILLEEVGIPRSEIKERKGRHIKKDGSESVTYMLQCCGVLDVIDFAKYIYGDDLNVWGSTLFLEKKRERFAEAYERWNDRAWFHEQVKAGKTYQEIADKLGIPMHVVANVALSIGARDQLRSKKWLHKEYVVNGRSLDSISRELGERKELVRRWVKRLGLQEERADYWQLGLL